jgi:hypothetical protein
MAHGYLGDGYGIHGEGDERRDDREHGWREHGSRDREWRGGNEDWRDRDRMFGGRESGWSGDDRWSDRGSRGGYGREQGSFDASSRTGRGVSAHPDDHYRSWRERHMSELDRDYEDYCREREQAFHQDFDAWRQQRSANYQPLRTGMTQSGISHDPSGQVQAATEGSADTGGSDPVAAATLGTNSETSGTGRGRR